MGFDDLARRMASSRGQAVSPLGDVSATALQREDQAAAARRQVAHGAVLLLIGIVITALTYTSASETGGTYYIVYGPIIVGIVKMIRGAISMPDRTPEQVAAAGRVVGPLPSARVVSKQDSISS
jgi:hypothetical protein